MRLRSDKVRELRKKLNSSGMYGAQQIAEKTALSKTTAWRILTRKSVAAESIYTLIRTCLKLPAGDLTEQQQNDLDEFINTHFEIDPIEGTVGIPAISSDTGQHMVCKTVYAKLIHLRDAHAEIPNPAYKRFIEHFNEFIDVFDEFIVIRTMLFTKKPEKTLRIEGPQRKSDYTALQPIYPPRTQHYDPYANPPLVRGIDHEEHQPEVLWQGAINVINGFQRDKTGGDKGSEFIYAHADDECDRLVLMVDFSSIPIRKENLFLTDRSPTAHHIRKSDNSRRRMQIEESEGDLTVFIVDTAKPGPFETVEPAWNPSNDRVLQRDYLLIRFPINWDYISRIDVDPKVRLS